MLISRVRCGCLAVALWASSVCCSGPIGIDVGTANSVVATPRRGGVDVLVNEASRRQTPSLVAFDEERRLLGQSASSQQTSKPESCVSDLKALIGRSFADAQNLRPQPYAKLIAAADGAAQVELQYDGAEQRFSPTQLFAMLLHKLYCSAEHELGSPPSECTIAVPLHFNAARRQAVLDAAEIAGLHGTRLISEVRLGASLPDTRDPDPRVLVSHQRTFALTPTRRVRPGAGCSSRVLLWPWTMH